MGDMGDCNKVAEDITKKIAVEWLGESKGSIIYDMIYKAIRADMGKDVEPSKLKAASYIFSEEFEEIKEELKEKKERDKRNELVSLYVFGRMKGLEKSVILDILAKNIISLEDHKEELENIFDPVELVERFREISKDEEISLDRNTLQRIVHNLRKIGEGKKTEGENFTSSLYDKRDVA